jgi:hypothetical protein
MRCSVAAINIFYTMVNGQVRGLHGNLRIARSRPQRRFESFCVVKILWVDGEEGECRGGL